MKCYYVWVDGLVFGMGYGGFEVILIIGLFFILFIVYVFVINNGMFEQFLINENIKQVFLLIQEQLLYIYLYEWLLGGIERISVIVV